MATDAWNAILMAPFSRKLIAILSLLPIIAITSCRGDQDVEGDRFITFTVTVPKNSSSARSGDTYSDDDHEKGNCKYFDVRIEKITARLVNPDLSRLTALSFFENPTITENPSELAYHYVGVIDVDDFRKLQEVENAKLMVFANVESDILPNEFRNPDVDDFTFSAYGTSSDFDAIPMWGVCAIDFSGISDSNKVIDLTGNVGSLDDGVWLLRAMAKVVVELDEDSRKVAELKSISFSRMNSSGYVVPFAWNTITDSRNIKIDSETLFDKASGDMRGFPIARADVEGVNSLTFYVPEIANSVDDEVVMDVSYSINGKLEAGQIRFMDYSLYDSSKTTDLWDIKRNHVYYFKISGLAQSTGLDVTATVNDWTYHRIGYEI